MTRSPNQPVHRTRACRFGFRVAGLSSLGFAADARFPAPVGDLCRSAMKGKPMTAHASRYAIVVVEANFTLDDPDEVVGSNLWFVGALFEEYLAADAIPAIRDFRPPH